MLFERSHPKVCEYTKEKHMKKQIGMVLIIGFLAAGCRPMGLPVPFTPGAATATTTPAAEPASPPTTQDADGLSPEPPAPVPEIDLSDLDDLLNDLDAALSNVDGAFEEGEEK